MSSEPGFTPPMPFRILVDEAMKLLRRHFRTIYFPVAIPVSLVYALMSVVQIAWLRDFRAMASGARAPSFTSGCLGVLAAFLATMIAQTLAYTAMSSACVDALEGRGVSMARSWRFVLQPRVLGTMLLLWLVLGVAFVCLFFPAIYVGLILSLVAPVMAAESIFGFKAMGRSSRLVRYNPQKRFLDNPKVKILALFLIGGVISYVVGLLVQVPFLIAQNVAVARAVAAGKRADPAELINTMLWFQVPSVLLGAFVSMAVAVYTSFGLALIYFDIRRRKEGMGLEAEIDRMTGNPPEAPAPVTPA